jgi:periplasmic divalent cation tolerance protein
VGIASGYRRARSGYRRAAVGEPICQLQVSHSDREALQAILDALVAERLIACGQLFGPMTSTFRWEGAVQHEQEWLALMKTAEDRVEQALARIAELHSYEVPEILVTRGIAGSESYLGWVHEETRARAAGG